jgi:hypothetical protein
MIGKVNGKRRFPLTRRNGFSERADSLRNPEGFVDGTELALWENRPHGGRCGDDTYSSKNCCNW